MYISIEGNIGSGKTEFINNICSLINNKYVIYTEPIEKWTSFNNLNLLKLKYENPNEYAYLCQDYIQLTLFDIHKQNHDYKLVERSLPSLHNVFNKYSYSYDDISEIQYKLLEEKHNIYYNSYNKINKFIYLRTDPAVAYNRIRQRNRSGEQNISLELIESIHALHEDWISNLNEDDYVIINYNTDIKDINFNEYISLF